MDNQPAAGAGAQNVANPRAAGAAPNPPAAAAAANPRAAAAAPNPRAAAAAPNPRAAGAAANPPAAAAAANPPAAGAAANPPAAPAEMAANEDWTVPLFQRAKDSVCFVVIAPRKGKIDDIEALAKKVETVDLVDQRSRSEETRMSTGFIVGTRDDHLLILTTAHAIDHVYKGSMPILGANSLFQASIICDHYEVDYRAAGLAMLMEDMRQYVPAVIVASNCLRDLLLIKVGLSDIRCQSNDQICPGLHPALPISMDLANAGEKSMLLSWPFERHRRVATGCVGVRRNVREVSRPNKNEYNMEILEADITSESGSSGAPLFNKFGRVIGLLHGGFGKTHSYFIPSDIILGFMNQYRAAEQRRRIVVDKKRKGKEVVGGEAEASENQPKHQSLRL